MPAGLRARLDLQAVLDAAVEAVILIDENGIIETFNRSAERLFGWTAAEVHGKNVSLLMEGADRVGHDGYIKRFLNTGEAKIIGIGREVPARRRDGSVFPAMLAVGEVQQSNPRRFVGFLHDITLRRQAEEAARQSEARLNHFARLSTMGEMAAGLAHEINQPLTAIATFSQAATRMLSRPEGIEREDLSEALDQITAQALRAGEVIRRLRAFVKNREVRHERVDCKRVVEDSRLLLEADARSNSVQLRLQVADSLPPITADPVQLQQVLINLVRNAIEASADVPGAHREVILSASLDGEGMVEVAVADHGHGLSTEAAERLFHPFFTTKPGGTGLGLVISSSIIRAHNGRLAYRSTPGGGCTFFFTLPPLGVLPGVESH
jgi:two-component system, LuxR family, sensor kinase FixL